MGWWSADIMGGDSPLDALSVIAKTCGIEYDYDDDGKNVSHYHGYPFTKEAIDKNIKKYFDKPPKYTDDKSIGFQACGMVIMYYGANLTKAMKDKIIAAAKEDDWYQQELKNSTTVKDRILIINKFIKQIESYQPGVRWEENEKGDFVHLLPNDMRFITEES